jgi:membrane protein
LNPIHSIYNFFKVEIWRIRLKDLPFAKSFGWRYVKVLTLSIKGFFDDKCDLRASALTFYSTLSVVPVVAMLFGVAKGFNFEDRLKTQLYKNFAGQEEILNRIMEFADSFLENTKGGLIAGFGVLVLFWTVIGILGNIESSFNAIWGIKKSRSIVRKLTDYLALMLFCPLLVVIASSATVFVATKLTDITAQAAFMDAFNPAIVILVRLLPICVIWILFTIVYIFMPNTKVNFQSALLAGVVAGTMYQMLQEGYIYIQVALSKYNVIYGSFSALPLFLIWLRLSWLIVLFGAEISFADQNVENTEYEPDALKVSPSYKKLLTLWVISHLAKRFCHGKTPPSDTEITEKLGIPIRLVRDILFNMTHVGILSEVTLEKDQTPRYQPGISVERLNIAYVLEAMEKGEINTLPIQEDQSLESLNASLKEFKSAVTKSPANVLLKEI